ncbi:MAG: hypothetical protein Q4P20_09405, partial [Eubacteriales bacterium]|nr:hypothetical protein [Eubacteriales bacterium]
ITIEVCFRGYTYPLMGLCGGLLLLLIDPINNIISWDIDLLIQGFMGSAMITSMEFVIGKLSPIQMWDYSNVPFNIDGIICLPFSLLWMLLSIVAIFIADAINYYVFDEEPAPYYHILWWTFHFK